MTKKGDKTFEEYAQRWREITSQIKPSLFENELATMFVDIFKYPFYEKVIGTHSLIFSYLVTIGEIVEIDTNS